MTDWPSRLDDTSMRIVWAAVAEAAAVAVAPALKRVDYPAEIPRRSMMKEEYQPEWDRTDLGKWHWWPSTRVEGSSAAWRWRPNWRD